MNIKVTSWEIRMFELDILTHLNHHTYLRASDNYPKSSGYDLGEQVTTQWVVHKIGFKALLGSAVFQKHVWRVKNFRVRMLTCFICNLGNILYYSDLIVWELTYWCKSRTNKLLMNFWELISIMCAKLIMIENYRKKDLLYWWL